jgi:hypothetical protein
VPVPIPKQIHSGSRAAAFDGDSKAVRTPNPRTVIKTSLIRVIGTSGNEVRRGLSTASAEPSTESYPLSRETSRLQMVPTWYDLTTVYTSKTSMLYQQIDTHRSQMRS